jgi:hypothetical protein
MKHIGILAILVLLAMAAMPGVIGNGDRTLAADYSCKTTTCTGTAQCSGDHWAQSGTCEITCYRDSGAPGQIVFNGSANCSPPSSGGSSSGSPGPVTPSWW